MSRKERGERSREFIEKFVWGRLGRKKEYGHYYVIGGSNCDVLMYCTPVQNPIPTIVAINFQKSGTDLVVSDYGNGHSGVSDAVPHAILTVIHDYIRENKLDITQARVVDIGRDGNNVVCAALLEIEGVKLLIDLIPNGRTDKFLADDLDNFQMSPRIKHVFKADASVEKIRDARYKLVPDGADYFYQGKWFVATEEVIEEESLSASDIEVLKEGQPTIFQFDLPIEFQGLASDWDISHTVARYNKETQSKILAYTAKLSRYLVAYNKIINITKHDMRGYPCKFLIGSEEDVTGGIARMNGEVFIKGAMYVNEEWSAQNLSLGIPTNKAKHICTFPNWHKIL